MNLRHKSDFLPILFLCIFSVYALKDLLIPGLFTSHDGETHTARIAQYYEAIKDGQIPPRYAGSFYNGFGSPIFVYIYPLPYAFGSILHQLGFSFVVSFKLIMGLGFTLSGVFAYYWLRQLTANKQAAFLGALYYMYSPYRLQLIYVRGSISELLAYTFLPLALYFVTKTNQSYSKKIHTLLALSVALILLSQNLVAIFTLPIIFGYSILLSYFSKSLSTAKNTLFAIVWAFAIGSFTYVPALFEREYIKFDEVINIFYSSHFVTLKQIIRSPWGYGFDLPGTVNDQMSFTIGLAHILLLGLCVVTFAIFSIKNSPVGRSKDIHLSNTNLWLAISYLAIVTCVLLVVENPLTKYIWKNIGFLQIIDIPWRILGLVPIFTALIGAIFASRYKAGLLFLFLVVVVIVANRNHIRINKASEFTDDVFINYSGTATQLSEFTPTERGNLSPPNFTVRDLPVNTASGWAKYTNVSKTSKEIKFKITVISQTAQVRINKFNFPGLKVKVYNENVTINPAATGVAPQEIRLDRTKDTSGFIYFPLDKGTYNVKISFGETPLRSISNLISLVSTIVAIYFLTKNAKKY